jgi:hypothetical protein
LIASLKDKNFVILFSVERIEGYFSLSSSMVDRNLFWIIDSLENFALPMQVRDPEAQVSLTSQ